MPTLILFRHGKSDWTGNQDDLHRPLAPRGRRGARTMGHLLSRTGQIPDAAITSPAERAFQTLRLAMEAGGWSCPVREADGFYGGEPADVLTALRREPPASRVLMAVGHEPLWSASVADLVGGGNVRMPTSAMARIDFRDMAWPDIEPGSGELIWLLTPRLVDPA